MQYWFRTVNAKGFYLKVDDGILHFVTAQVTDEIDVKAILEAAAHSLAELDGVVLEGPGLNLCEVDLSQGKS